MRVISFHLSFVSLVFRNFGEFFQLLRDSGNFVERSEQSTWGVCTRRAGKLYRARSLLYRSRFLKVNTRVKARDEIYKIYRLSYRTDLKISAKKSSEYFQNEYAFFKISRFPVLFPRKFCNFYVPILMTFCRNFATLLRKCNFVIYSNLQKLCQILRTISRNFRNFRNFRPISSFFSNIY